jgi:hypothetical protein
MPYDWRSTGFLRRLKQRWWNPAEPRLFVPEPFGWGYDLNVARLLRRKPKVRRKVGTAPGFFAQSR